jgi:hypothetical protein
MHYISIPPQDIVDDLCEIFGFKIEPLFKQDWINIHTRAGFELSYWNDYSMNDARLPTFTDLYNFLISRYKDADITLIKECAELILQKSKFYESVFIRNRKHLRYHVTLFKKKSS